MREYTVAAALVLVVALVVAGARGLWWDRAVWLGMVAFGVLTLAFDVAMTGIGLFGYAASPRSGLGVGRMPIEDLAYGLALYLVAIIAWAWDADDTG